MHVAVVEVDSDTGPLGVRGVGEGPTCSTAIANAVDDAFDGRLDIRDPVMTPERVRHLILNARPG